MTKKPVSISQEDWDEPYAPVICDPQTVMIDVKETESKKVNKKKIKASTPSLSTPKHKQIWTWASDDGKSKIEVAPSYYGRATAFDKKLLIFAIIQIMVAINRGDTHSKKIRFKAADFLKEIDDNDSELNYETLTLSLARLCGTQITTTINTGNTRITQGFGLINSLQITKDSSLPFDEIFITLTLSEWIYNITISQETFTINHEFFTKWLIET
ncbi:MAG: replication initiator protein A [Candidatus Berkiella sp.]